MKLYFLIAKRFLFPSKKFSSSIVNFISFIGLFIGAAAIVLSVSVLNGFQDILKSEYIKLNGQFLIEDYDKQLYESTKRYLDLFSLSQLQTNLYSIFMI